ncbi:MAG TPA: Stp1/IreP family PP2C-type Ser/Thr phosphatase, partial [Blastocatellia bacterium]
TDVGMRRPGNEDAFMVADLTSGNVGLGPEMSTHQIGARGSLVAVSDGMGGAAAGEVASEMAVNIMREALLSAPADMQAYDQLTRAVAMANDRIWKHSKQNDGLSGMGATLTAALLWSKYAYIAQVGDSRAYLVRGDRIKQLTKDQSLVQMLLESGAIAPDQASSVPHNVIIQALGTSPTVDAAVTVAELSKNDILILCSDGLSNKVSDDEIKETVSKEKSLTNACRSLVELANQRGGEDNITIVVARFDGEELQSAADGNSITGSFQVIEHGCLGGDLSAIVDQMNSRAEAASQKAESKVTTLVMNRLEDESGAEISEQDGSVDAANSDAANELEKSEAGISAGYLKYALFILAALFLIAAALFAVLYFRKPAG